MSSYLLFNTYTNTKRIFQSSHNSLSFFLFAFVMKWDHWFECHIIFFQRHSFLFLPLFRTLLPADETAAESSQFRSPSLLYLCTYRAHKLSFLLACFLLRLTSTQLEGESFDPVAPRTRFSPICLMLRIKTTLFVASPVLRCY